MGATRFSGVVRGQSALESASSSSGTPRATSIFPTDRHHLRVSGMDFGTTSVMSISVEEGPLLGRTLHQHPEGLVCTFMLEGSAIFDDGRGKPMTVNPGSSWTYGGASDVRVTWGSTGRAVVAIVPPQVVRDFGMVPAGGLALMPRGSTLLEPTRSFLSSLLTGTGKISSVAAYFMEKLIHEMVGGLFLEESSLIADHSNRPTLYHQAMALITALAGEQRLTPGSLARDLNVSLRHLQRDFQKRNESVAGTIRRTRAGLAIRLLSDPTMTVLSLDQIAEHSGFTSLGHLRRTLHSVGAGTPREIRTLSAETPADSSPRQANCG